MTRLLFVVICVGAVSTGTATAARRPVLRNPIEHGLASRADTQSSSNWAGYAIVHKKPFTSVTGRWLQPTATCSDLSPTYSAFWVGLGGFSRRSFAVEQTGTIANCSSGSPYYQAWYELYPAPPVMLRLPIHPGDALTATVSVNKTAVLMRLMNVTTGKLYRKLLRMSHPDTGSAEWVAEAPSGCDYTGNCATLPLTNFGTIDFTHGTASIRGHKGRISDPTWTSTTIELRGDLADPRQPSLAGANAIPGALGGDGGSFAVTWEGLAAPPPAG